VSQSPFSNDAYLNQILAKAVAAKASDVHLKVGQPPGARVRGEMVYFRLDRIQPADTEALARILVKRPEALARFDELTEFDTSYGVQGLGRFRVNLYKQRGSFAAVLRNIPPVIPTFDDIRAPLACKDLAERSQGLVLVVGASGSGKSTTLASMVGHMNSNFPLHIVTIEDPIEYLHPDLRSSVSQREVGVDTPSFAIALRASLRQDPDVILVGEIRDQDTMDTALKAAETGHLVLGTLHSSDVQRTINRIMALMSDTEPQEVRERLADALEGIVAQRLVPRLDGQGLALVAEVLVATGTARESIRAPHANPSLKDIMEKGVSPYNMQTFDMHYRELVQRGLIDRSHARGLNL
jgi:twitching motility protein PilT